ncbi:MAG TPA: helix-turn-helix transcriptional regulator [Polyangiaceae bacterium]|nr:helix-turn-helix transcriptional regulator [Polyangiaceae bacterium]
MNLDSFRATATPVDLAEVWARLAARELVVLASGATDDSASLTIKAAARLEFDESLERSLNILRRVLLGETQKAVAANCSIAASTVAMHCSRGLTRMGAPKLTTRTPLVLVIAAHASAGFAFPFVSFENVEDGALRIAVRLAGPQVVPHLSGVERDILRGVTCGLDNTEIATKRGTSRRTIANQLGSLFRKFGVSGRGELLAKIARSLALHTPNVLHEPQG